MADELFSPNLKPFFRIYDAGRLLFQQGDIASTLIIVLDGRIHLLEERDGEPYVAAIVQEGEILGERVLSHGNLYPRAFTAKAETETSVLELSSQDLRELELKDPTSMAALLRLVLRVVSVRFDRANQLIRLMKKLDPQERMLQLIRYYMRYGSEDGDILLSAESFFPYVALELSEIEKRLGALVIQGLMKRVGKNRYQVPDEKALMNAKLGKAA